MCTCGMCTHTHYELRFIMHVIALQTALKLGVMLQWRCKLIPVTLSLQYIHCKSIVLAVGCQWHVTMHQASSMRLQ